MEKDQIITASKFADPTVDFAFKRIFGTDRFKAATIGLINSIILDRHIVNVSFLNVEIPRETKDGKSVAIDVLCTDENNNRFIVEMQKAKQSTFRQRMVFYASKLISLYDVMKGDGGYDLTSTYVIAFLNYKALTEGVEGYRMHYITRDEDRGDRMPGSPEYFFYDLTRFNKPLSECATSEEKFLYLLCESKHLEIEPEELSRDEYFATFLEAARRANFTSEEEAAYVADMMTDFDYKNSLRESKAEGYAQGVAQRNIEMARAMKTDGMSVEMIAKYTGLSKEEIEKL